MSAKTVTFELSKEEAFTVLAVLSRHVYNGNTLETRSDVEQLAVRALCQSIDDELVETFRDDYKRFVEGNK